MAYRFRYGTAFNNELYGDAGDDWIYGFDGNDILFGWYGNDILVGGSGDDYLSGGAGADTLLGDVGFDYASYAGSGPVRVDLALNSGWLGEAEGDLLYGIEGLIGSGGDDYLWGDANTNTFYGHGGRDRLYGRAGDDQLYGESGDDTLDGGEGGDLLDGGDGHDSAVYSEARSGVCVSLRDGFGYGDQAEGDRFVGIENLTGSLYADMLVGDHLANNLYGNPGEDQLFGLGDDDRLLGGRGNDLLNAGDGEDYLSGEEDDDTLIGGAGGDVLFGGFGWDTASYIDAGAGVTARLYSPTGNTGDAARDRYISVEALAGSAFDDILGGDDNANELLGNNGNDYLVGGRNADQLRGGAGSDSMDGGEGTDWFMFSTSDLGFGAVDTIIDFEDGTDTIFLTGFRREFTTVAQVGGSVHITEAGYANTIVVQVATIAQVQAQLFFA